MASLQRFVGDRLYEVLGYSDGALADYVVAAVRSSSYSTDKAMGKLRDFGMPDTASARELLREVARRIKGGGSSTSKKPKVVTNADMQRQAMEYALVPDDDEDAAPRLKRKEKRRKKRSRESRKAEKEKKSSNFASAKVADGDAEHARLLKEYEEFVGGGEEREEFEKRLRERDDAKTKRKVGAAAITDDAVKKMKASMPELRTFARQEYLKKREARELDILKFAIKDEELLFAGEALTEKEKKRLEVDKKLLDIATNRVQELDNDVRYTFPESMDLKPANAREKVLDARYVEEKRESHQQAWEDHQISKAKRGTKKMRNMDAGEEKVYDLVFEDQIDFISTELMQGKDPGKDMKGKTDAQKSKQSSVKMTLAEVRKSLPIYPYRDDFLAAVRDHQVLIVVGETGSGKTTQIPQYLHEVGYTDIGRVGCTQPRRVAAMSVAARVAQEVGVKLGNEVGYSIRFEDCTSKKTQIQYMTDGMLLRYFMSSPDLADFSCMMVDEAHERTLHTDVLFGLLKDICRFRSDLRLVVSSATLDAQKFSEFFDNAPIFNIPGRRYPVDILYTKAPEADYLDAAVVTSLQVHVSQPLPGDILVFLTGQAEIEAAQELLLTRTRGLGSKIKELIISPIYASLPAEEQAKVFVPTPKNARKVILATNIAETSLTIDGIRYVIDTGFCKSTSYNPRNGMDSLIVTPVSKAMAMQRSGRAGRTAPGKCFRLYTAWSFRHELDENTVPEIQRTNLASVVLLLKSIGVDDMLNFDFMDPPPAECLIRALEHMYALGALNDKGELTKVGRRMAELPSSPMASKMLLSAEKYKCTEEAMTICAMMDVGSSVYFRPKERAIHADTARRNFARGVGANGDQLALLNVFNSWRDTNFSSNWVFENFLQEKSLRRARDIREQLSGLCERVELERVSNPDPVAIRKCITSGYFYHLAKLQKSGNYKTVKNNIDVYMHPSSSLYKIDPLPRWLVYHQLQYTQKEYMREVIIVDPEWLIEIAPHYYRASEMEDGSKKKMPKVNVRNSAVAENSNNSSRRGRGR